MVRSPSTFQLLSPSPRRTALLRKLIVGWSSTLKRSLDRRWASRSASLVSMVEASISISSDDSLGDLGESIAQVPTSGTWRPLMTRLPG